MEFNHKRHDDLLEEVWEECCGFQHVRDEHHHHECHEKDDICSEDCHCKHLNNCVCIILKKLEKTHKTFIFRTKSGDEITGMIKCFDKCTGCVIIIQPEMISPKLPAVATIISCTDIESISFEIKHR
ncbi:hypothetical protein A8F94_17960 [Bacillus sp. FJAT-27225]|uniref:hypothetical protein n=1 Tax=Bacillus sp. FJAT-27225 TaxID=1743144 RepID=UPI00080C2250|nr:hypothetical protein [Bacillus sp. FJAT-27225]OCA83031.1 hypothetical protein A8F94_17960 [Bacillus sp. FJAT-27225]